MQRHGVRWKNWCGNESCTAVVQHPADRKELRTMLREAARRGPVRVLGEGASWSPLVATRGSLIALDQLRGRFELGRDAGGATVRVRAGTTVRTLVAMLEASGLTLMTPTVFQDVSIGGAIATGSHGTGLGSSTLSDEVVALTLVTVAGEVLELTEKDGELFRAAQVSLGTLGVIFDVTLRCVPAFRVFVQDRYLPRDQVLDSLADLTASHPFVELYWFPFSQAMFVKAMAPAHAAVDRPTWRERIAAPVRRALTMSAVHAAFPVVARVRPSTTRTMMPIAPLLSSFVAGERVESAAQAFRYQLAYPRCITMSYGVPLAAASEAWRRVIELVEREGAEGRFPVDMVAHARFIGASEASLSMAHGRATCDIEVVSSRSAHTLAGFHEKLAQRMLGIPGARPHWGKLIVRPETIRAAYPAMDGFLAHRAALDPGRVLLNDFLEHRVFGLDSPRSHLLAGAAGPGQPRLA